MKITLKLYAALSDLLPPSAHAHAIHVEVSENATPNQVVDRYKVPRNMAHLVLLNGIYLGVEDRDKPVLRRNDALAIWPPVAGG